MGHTDEHQQQLASADMDGSLAAHEQIVQADSAADEVAHLYDERLAKRRKENIEG